MIDLHPSAPCLSPDIISAAADFSSSLLSDAMGGRGTMNAAIKPIASGQRLLGMARTVDIKAGNGKAVIAAAATASPGDVLVIAAKGNVSQALFGDMLTRIALKAGVTGVVIDGAVRDVAEIAALGMPCFSAGAVPCGGEKAGPGAVNVTVACAGVAVAPGDLVLGDDTGVVVVPRSDIDSIFEAARQKLAAEERILADVARGKLKPAWLEELLEEQR